MSRSTGKENLSSDGVVDGLIESEPDAPEYVILAVATQRP